MRSCISFNYNDEKLIKIFKQYEKKVYINRRVHYMIKIMKKFKNLLFLFFLNKLLKK